MTDLHGRIEFGSIQFSMKNLYQKSIKAKKLIASKLDKRVHINVNLIT